MDDKALIAKTVTDLSKLLFSGGQKSVYEMEKIDKLVVGLGGILCRIKKYF